MDQGAGRDRLEGTVVVALPARQIDGTNRDINLEVIRLRNASAMSSGSTAALGTFDLDALQRGADAFHSLGLVTRQIKVSDVVDTSLLPTR